jgi:hypothetical protein
MQDSEDTPKPASPSDHVWYHSEGDDKPMGSMKPRLPINSGEGDGQIGLGRNQRSGRGRKMAEALQHEKVDEHGKTIKRLTAVTIGLPRKSRQAKKQRVDTTEIIASSDEDDRDFQDTESAESESTSPSESNCQDALLPSNAEACFL